MKIKLLSMFIIFAALSLTNVTLAQQSIFRGSSTAGMVSDTMIFNCDFIDPIGLPAVNVTMHYRGQSQTSFSTAPMTLMQGDPHYLTTQESRLFFNSNQGQMQYYFSGGGDTIMLSQAPQYTGAATWPASGLFADFSADPVGDTLSGTPGQWLDLTGYGMTYSDTKLYGYLSNVTGNWPSNQGLSLYLYGIALIHPSIQESTIFAMININLWPLISPGVYKINVADSSFTRVANVTSTTSGGRLFMSCNLADLAADPDWPGWPPPNGYMITMATTGVGSLTSPALCDFTMPTFFEPISQSANFNTNAAPQLYNPGMLQVPLISLTAHVAYYDSDNNLPKIRRLYFDRGIFEMASFDHVYSDTAIFEYTMAWPGVGWHNYYFVFSDGRDSARTALDSIYISPTSINNPLVLPGEIALAQNYPNPFNSSTNIAFSIASESSVKLTIYDLVGRNVIDLVDGVRAAGRHNVNWDGIGQDGRKVTSGIYFYKLSVDGVSSCRSMLLLK